jgi:hypothetical protein
MVRKTASEGKALSGGPWAYQLLAVFIVRQTSPDIRVRVRCGVVAIHVPQPGIGIVVPITTHDREILAYSRQFPFLQ